MFGRIFEHDDRNLNFLLQRQPIIRLAWTWAFGHPAYDQGRHGTCVGHGGKDLLVSRPTPQTPYDGPPTPVDCYQLSCRNDGFHGGHDDPTLDTGSSVLGLMKGLRSSNLIKAYGWAYDPAVVKSWVLAKGPVVIGVNWYTGMMTPAKDGSVAVTGSVEGGHCVLVIGYRPERGFRILNSWGPDWGQKGRCWLPYEGLGRLLSEQGEAATPTE